MTGSEIEVALFDEDLLDAIHDQDGVTIAELWDQDANGKGLFTAQRAGIEAGAVIELLCRSQDAVACLLGDGTHAGRVVEDQRDRRGRQIKIIAQYPEADRPAREEGTFFLSGMRLRFRHTSLCNVCRENVQPGKARLLDFSLGTEEAQF